MDSISLWISLFHIADLALHVFHSNKKCFPWRFSSFICLSFHGIAIQVFSFRISIFIWQSSLLNFFPHIQGLPRFLLCSVELGRCLNAIPVPREPLQWVMDLQYMLLIKIRTLLKDPRNGVECFCEPVFGIH